MFTTVYITLSSYSQRQNISNPNNFKVLVSKENQRAYTGQPKSVQITYA